MNFCNKMGFPCQKYSKYPDPSDKMDLDFWDYFGRILDIYKKKKKKAKISLCSSTLLCFCMTILPYIF